MGSLVWLAMTCPLRVNVVGVVGAAGDGAAGDNVSVSLPLQASTGTRSNSVHVRFNIERFVLRNGISCSLALHRRLHDERLTRADTPGDCYIHRVFGSRGYPKDG